MVDLTLTVLASRVGVCVHAPDAQAHHNPDPDYIASLIDKTGLTRKEIARRLGISTRAIGYYIQPASNAHHVDAPYTVQVALELLSI